MATLTELNVNRVFHRAKNKNTFNIFNVFEPSITYNHVYLGELVCRMSGGQSCILSRMFTRFCAAPGRAGLPARSVKSSDSIWTLTEDSSSGALLVMM